MALLAPLEKSKYWCSGGNMVVILERDGVDERAPPGMELAA